MLDERYVLPEMKAIWNDQAKFEYWLNVEKAVIRARSHLGEIPALVATDICDKVKVNEKRVKKLEQKFHHDMIAFITCAKESLSRAGLGKSKDEFHRGPTSYDIEDPALVQQLRDATEVILDRLNDLRETLEWQSEQHQWTVMIARTHVQSAQPSTFGHLLRVYREAVIRSIDRIGQLLDVELTQGKLSGAVGNYAILSPEIERITLEILNLVPAETETQILQRDRHAAVTCNLAIVAATIKQIAMTFHGMMHSEVGELQEPFGKSQRGSSAMPHKRNPHKTERIIGLAREVFSCVTPALENVATLDFRDISQSSVERLIFPRAFCLVHFMTVELTKILDELVVYPGQMEDNLEATQGVWASQRVTDALVKKGVSQNAVYLYVQRCAFTAIESDTNLKVVLRNTSISGRTSPRAKTALKVLGTEELDRCFDVKDAITPGILHIFEQE